VLALLCLTPSAKLHADPLLKVSPDTPHYNARPYLLYLEDPTGMLDIGAVKALDDSAFKPLGQNQFSGGYSKSVFWLRLDMLQKVIPDAKDSATLWVMEINYAALDYVDLYHEENGTTVLRRSGDRLPFSQRHSNANLHTYQVYLQPGTAHRYYLRIETSSSLQLPIHIWSPSEVYDQRLLSRLAYGIYFGIFIIMALYNLFLYFSLQDRSYLFYVLYILSFGLLQSSISGLSYRYLWPESPAWANINIPFFMATACFFGTMFSRLFLSTKTLNNKLDLVLRVIVVISFFCALLPFFFSYETALNANNALTAVVTIAVIIAGIIASKRGSPGAKYFLMGWSAILIGATLFMLHSTGIVPANPLTLHASEIGSSIEVLLLSLALGDRIKNLREDKARTEERARDMLAQANAELSNTLMQLEKSNSLKDEFLAKVSHELRTPLNGISGSIELMQYENLSPRLNEYAKSAELSSKHMLELVNTLLKFAESQADDIGLARDEIHLDELCATIARNYKSLLQEKATTLRYQISDATPTALIGDENKLCLVLQELLEHCLSIGKNGTLSINIATEKLAIKNCLLIFRFEMQSTTAGHQERHGGLGIGLTICQQLVNQMKGELYMDENRFEMTLPFDLPQSEFISSS
jgi:signal transduction histidine kinase